MLAAQKLYPDSIIIFPGSQEKNLRDFFISSTSYLFNMADPGSIDFSHTLKLVLVDTRQKSRLPQVSELLNKKDIKIEQAKNNVYYLPKGNYFVKIKDVKKEFEVK